MNTGLVMGRQTWPPLPPPLEGHTIHVCAILQYTLYKRHIQLKLTCNTHTFNCQSAQNLAWIKPQVVIWNYRLSSTVTKPQLLHWQPLWAGWAPMGCCPVFLLPSWAENDPAQQALSTQTRALLSVTHLWAQRWWSGDKAYHHVLQHKEIYCRNKVKYLCSHFQDCITKKSHVSRRYGFISSFFSGLVAF